MPPPHGPAHPVVVPYDPCWPARAAALLEELRSCLGRTATRIEHIGSTAVPGMDAKDVLDIQVSVESLDAAAHGFLEPLSQRGFQPFPATADHVPAGRDGDPARWAKLVWSRRDHPGGDVNLHVRVAGAPNERLALLFRDWLRANPDAVPAYGAFKHALAAAVPDVATYAEVKDPVVDLVIAVAEEWASATGWEP